jgi:hypothetical protein
MPGSSFSRAASVGHWQDHVYQPCGAVKAAEALQLQELSLFKDIVVGWCPGADYSNRTAARAYRKMGHMFVPQFRGLKGKRGS